VFNYTALVATASRLISNFGGVGVVTRTAGATFNPATGNYTGGTTTTITGKGVRIEFDKSEIDGSVIQAGDVRILFDADGGTPINDDNLSFNSTNYRVMNVKPQSPSGTDIYYELQCRR